MRRRKTYKVVCGSKELHTLTNKQAAIAIARDETGIYNKRCCVYTGKRRVRCFQP